MTYRELDYKATRLLDNGKITLGEYEEMTKPLDREVEQEPILDKIRAEISALKSHHINDCYDDGFQGCRTNVLQIIDKYKSESEG